MDNKGVTRCSNGLLSEVRSADLHTTQQSSANSCVCLPKIVAASSPLRLLLLHSPVHVLAVGGDVELALASGVVHVADLAEHGSLSPALWVAS